jgi:hypothetical protein
MSDSTDACADAMTIFREAVYACRVAYETLDKDQRMAWTEDQKMIAKIVETTLRVMQEFKE